MIEAYISGLDVTLLQCCVSANIKIRLVSSQTWEQTGAIMVLETEVIRWNPGLHLASPPSEEGSGFLRVSVMDSCFPPLAALSLRDHHKSNGHQPSNNCHGRPASTQQPPGEADNYGKIEILQDLDLYYIRQIAHNLQVVTACWPAE